MTIHKMVLDCLKCEPYKHGATATQICHYLNMPSGVDDFGGVKLSSLSSTLKRMYDAGELIRIEGFGPRGGYGYLLGTKAHRT